MPSSIRGNATLVEEADDRDMESAIWFVALTTFLRLPGRTKNDTAYFIWRCVSYFTLIIIDQSSTYAGTLRGQRAGGVTRSWPV